MLVDPIVRAAFWQEYMALRLFWDPLLLIVKAAGTLALFVPYIQGMIRLERRLSSSSSWRQRYPLVLRLVALGLAFVVNNILLCGVASLVMFGIAGLWLRLVS